MPVPSSVVTRRSTRSRRDRADAPVPVPQESRLRDVGLVLVIVEIVLLSLVFDPAGLETFTVPKAILARSLASLSVAVLVALIVTGSRHELEPSALHIAVLGFLGVYVLATVFALDRSLALWGAHDRQLGLITVASLVVLYFSSARFVRSGRDRVVVGAAVATAAAVVAGYSFVQWAGADPLPWATDSSIRTFSTVGNPTILGHYLITVTAAVLGVALLGPIAGRRRLALLALASIPLLGAVTSGSRAIVLGLLTGGLVLLILAWVQLSTNRSRAVLGAGYVVVFAAMAAVVLLSPLSGRLAALAPSADAPSGSVVSTRDPSVAGRIALYEVAVRAVSERPLLGIGPDNYAARFPKLRSESAASALQTTVPETSAHSWVLKIATDAGLLGLIALLVVCGVAAWKVLRAGSFWEGKVALVTLASFLATGTVTVSDVSTEWLPWLALGIIAGGTRESRRGSRHHQRRGADDRRARGRVRSAAAGLVIVGGLVLAATAIPTWEANRAAELARRSRAGGDHAAALQRSERALSLDPRPARYWHGRGLAEIGMRAPAKARTSFAAAVEREPYNAAFLGSLARAELALAQSGVDAMRDRAIATANRAVLEDPNNPDSHFTRALVAFVLGQHAQAVAAGERGLALGPPRLPDESVPDAVARAYLALGRPADAEPWARRGAAQFDRSVDLRTTLARVLLAMGRLAEALAVVEEALAMQPTNAAALNIKAEIGRR